MEILRNDPHLAACRGADGNKWVRENFDFRIMNNSYSNLYSGLLIKGK
jgi:hypothetical protein